MRTSELLPLLDREAERLTSENDHCAASLMKEAAAHLREQLCAPPPVLVAPGALVPDPFFTAQQWPPPSPIMGVYRPSQSDDVPGPKISGLRSTLSPDGKSWVVG